MTHGASCGRDVHPARTEDAPHEVITFHLGESNWQKGLGLPPKGRPHFPEGDLEKERPRAEEAFV